MEKKIMGIKKNVIVNNKSISMEEVMAAMNFLSSNTPKSTTYKRGTIVSAGEGGNRHLWFFFRPLEDWEILELKYSIPSDGVHLHIDTHTDGAFLYPRVGTPDAFITNCSHRDEDGCINYLYIEQVAVAILETIAAMK